MTSAGNIKIGTIVQIIDKFHRCYKRSGTVIGVYDGLYKIRFEDEDVGRAYLFQLEEDKKAIVNNILKEL